MSQAFFASAMRTGAEVSHAPSLRYSSTTSCPVAVRRATVPPQPYSGSPGWPPVTTTLHFLGSVDGVRAFCAALSSAITPAATPAPASSSRRFMGPLLRVPHVSPLHETCELSQCSVG